MRVGLGLFSFGVVEIDGFCSVSRGERGKVIFRTLFAQI